VTIDPTNKRLMVVAPAVEHTAVKSAVEQFEKGLPEEKGKLVAYPVTQAQRKRFQAVLKTLTTELPGIEVIADAEPGELAVWAKPEQHKVIAEVLEQLKREVPAAEKYVLAAYALTTADPTSVTTVLKSMFPTLQVVHDPKTNRLLAWALPSEQEALKKTIDQLQAQAPTDKLPRFETYLLHGAEPTALTASLQTLAPNAKITSDAKAGRLVVWATPAEHEVIRGAMEKLGRGTTIENTPQVESYRLSRVDPTTLVPLLQSLVPDAKISVDAQTKTLIVVAIPADQQTVRGVVQQFQPDKPGRDTPELRAYPITSADPASVMSVLKTTFPTLQITLEPKTNRLLAWAAPFEHDALKKTLEQVQAQVPPDKLPRFET
jgi:type II secretory pathway component GspD/PulD (secretin)